MISTKSEGWCLLNNAIKWHYFREGLSLCNRWMLVGESKTNPTTMSQGCDDAWYNCKACQKVLDRKII